MIEPLVRPGHILVYHWSGRPSTLFGPPIVELGIVFLLLSACLLSAERGRVWRSVMWSAVILFLPWVVLHQVVEIRAGLVPHWFRLPPFYFALILWPLLVLIWSRFADQRETAIEVATTVLAFTALSSVLLVTQMFWFWWKARAIDAPLAAHPAPALNAARPKARVIFILMDELSYQQLYEHRYAGLHLPAFDALAAQSTVLTHVVPTGNFTEHAVPALLTGEPVDLTRATSAGMLEVHNPQSGKWKLFDENQTVFRDALNAGYRTAVVGWYNPYCRMMPDVLDFCYWSDAIAVKEGLTPEGTFRSNLLTSTDVLLHAPTVRNALYRTLRIPASFDRKREWEGHLDDYVKVRAASDEVLLDRTAGFTFLHLPIPHPDGIYSRATHQLTTGPSTYIDNLALADSYLAHARQLLEATGQWDSSTILVMGDHGWRTTLMWKQDQRWSAEEERASLGGTFDTRPAYIVKLAGQTSGMRIDEPFDALRTRALTDELLTGEIQSPDQLKEWLDKQGTKEQAASDY